MSSLVAIHVQLLATSCVLCDSNGFEVGDAMALGTRALCFSHPWAFLGYDSMTHSPSYHTTTCYSSPVVTNPQAPNANITTPNT